jgi:ABC-type branched-subunit amino acid transport system ATPase component
MVVGKVLTSTEQSMQQARNVKLREKGEWIVENMGACREKMLDMQTAMMESGEIRVEKEFKSKLAGLAFDMARETKELVRTVEDIDNESRRLLTGVDLS